jgi:RimJ/RimL family protein N-acetyltransferase
LKAPMSYISKKMESSNFFLPTPPREPRAIFLYKMDEPPDEKLEGARTKIVGERVILRPYVPSHVAAYHVWMQDADILRDTCSEPLSLEEEYAMNIAWRDDPTKWTFIVCERTCQDENEDVCAHMVGDVNLYFTPEMGSLSAEIEVMIAEKSARRKGLALEALTLMREYGQRVHNRLRFVAKILVTNKASVNLFVNKLGFAPFDGLEVPGEPEKNEVHLEWEADGFKQALEQKRYYDEQIAADDANANTKIPVQLEPYLGLLLVDSPEKAKKEDVLIRFEADMLESLSKITTRLQTLWSAATLPPTLLLLLLQTTAAGDTGVTGDTVESPDLRRLGKDLTAKDARVLKSLIRKRNQLHSQQAKLREQLQAFLSGHHE